MVYCKTYRFFLVLWLSTMLVTVGYNSVRLWFVQGSHAIAKLSDIENPKDGCDDESGEQKESKTKEKLDDFVDFQPVGNNADVVSVAGEKAVARGLSRQLQTVALDVLAPPPKA